MIAEKTRAPEAGIIDVHQHVFWYGKTPKNLVEDMDKNKISRACLLTWEIPTYCNHRKVMNSVGILNPKYKRSDGTHPGLIFEDIIEACQKYPDRFLSGYCPDPLNPNASELFYDASIK